jgi:hypothetical protein
MTLSSLDRTGSGVTVGCDPEQGVCKGPGPRRDIVTRWRAFTPKGIPHVDFISEDARPSEGSIPTYICIIPAGSTLKGFTLTQGHVSVCVKNWGNSTPIFPLPEVKNGVIEYMTCQRQTFRLIRFFDRYLSGTFEWERLLSD